MFKLSATIPVGQYANIIPEIECDGDYETAKAEAFARLSDIWKQYGVVPLNNNQGERKLLKAFSGGEVYYDGAAHVYTNEAGEIYQSGSQYADTFRKPFDKDKIAKLMADKVGVSPADIIAMWELKGEASRDFGNAIHKALQLYEQYDGLATALNKTTNSHDHPVIKQAVDGFIEAHRGEKVISEALIVDHENKRAGQVDRLLITGRKECYITDFKTNADIQKDISIYWKQLEFYGGIMEHNGWTVKGLKIYHYNGEWTEYDYQAS